METSNAAAVNMKKPKSLLGVRHLQVVMLSLGIAVMFAMRVNMAVAIVAMTDSDNENAFSWSIQTQSVILSSFFWSYAVLQVPAGELAARVGGKLMLAVAVGINSAICMLIPLGAHYVSIPLGRNIKGGLLSGVCVCRVVQGLSQGVLYPSIHNLIAKWVPLEERSRMASIIYAGGALGTAGQNLVSGYIAYAWGWTGIFYANAGLGVLWTVVYVALGAASPQSSAIIGDEERHYIQSALGQLQPAKKLAAPWRAMMTSWSFISVIVAQAGVGWGHWTLQTEMPTFFKLVLGVDIKQNGVITALPYLAMFASGLLFGYLSDYMHRHSVIGLTFNRKLFNTIASLGPAMFLIAMSYAPASNLPVAVSLLTLAVGTTGAHYSGYILSHIDMAPNFAGTMMGISNGLANIVSIIAPLAAGAILKDETNPAHWHRVFYLSAVVYVVTNLLYVLCVTSDRQTWNEEGSKSGSLEKPAQSCAENK